MCIRDRAYHQETHDAYNAILHLGLYDMFDQFNGKDGEYTFWDYQRGAWQNNEGIRIDHLLCSPQAIDRARGLDIHKLTRDGVKPSDHVPVVGEFDF